MKPTFDDLNYFLEVANTKNLSRAAERQGITQPSISAAMKRLELSFGTALLIRSRNGVQLTKAGVELQTLSKKFMSDWDQLKSSVIRASTEMGGSFTIGCHPSVALYTLPTIVPKLKAKYPLLTLNFVHDLSRKITEQVISHEIDFGLVINPVRHPDLVIQRLFFDEVTIWGNRDIISIQNVLDKNFTLYCDPNLKQTKELLKKIPHLFKIEFSNSLEVIAALVANGAGLGILPKRVAKVSHKPLRKLDDVNATVIDELCLVYRADAQSNAISQKLRHEIRMILSEH
ncbi:LysR family transcriptional regulator [Endozoicomonas sp. SM1973]|uniref:LysR family transcriptional regulator n=1 Tax=Spartinivicinus marinus TaxID=2994442 RepID=A0A853IAV0_9GAMM|nr:LysR family transcriptional regulator [Spartinivicinus marinus]MCX4029149.1 LysR family transcriptional regulator [Spartinivicinus marinus]NYZ67768.1 LysR family transcriptional regulator [Spartinivicinus marinus]